MFRRVALILALLAITTVMQWSPAMAVTNFTFATEQAISDTVNGLTTQQHTMPASLNCFDIQIQSADWDLYSGLGTFSWWTEHLDNGKWVKFGVGQSNEQLGIRGKNGLPPSIGICRDGLGADQFRVRFVATIPVTIGITGAAT